MENIFQHCDFCSRPIQIGQQYGTLVYNVETYNQNSNSAHGSITVHDSDQVHIMCLKCGERYNRENVKEEINQIANQGFKVIEPIENIQN